MKIHEYQGKEILARFGIPVPRGYPAFSVREATEAAQKLGGGIWVVKAQIHAGGRGKGGGVKLARSEAEVSQLAGQILGMQLVTHQTGPQGQKVRRLLIEEGADIKKEYYVAVLTDRATQKVALMGSSEGGMDIEKVAHDTPEKILKVFVDPVSGLADEMAASTFANLFAAAPSRPMPKASLRAWNGTTPTPASIASRRICSGWVAATSSMSMPPAALAITTGLALARSITMLRYSSRAICSPSSTSTRLTFLPSGPVWWVTSVIPSMSLVSCSTSPMDRASFTPPPLPRPPAWICALTTHTSPPSRRAMSAASTDEKATSPRGTGTP